MKHSDVAQAAADTLQRAVELIVTRFPNADRAGEAPKDHPNPPECQRKPRAKKINARPLPLRPRRLSPAL
jgi:hypothetical protein